jgi:formylglycine-generating enzyme required for sulfatase activity
LLSNDNTRIRAAVEKIEPHDRDGYVKRLLGIIEDYKSNPAKARVSAGNALAYLGDPRDFDEMVDVPAGEFLYGDEKEKRTIDKPFRIGKYPVTNAQYKKFADATKRDVPRDWDEEKRACPEGKANHPVVCVTWDDAQAYCEWLSKATGEAYRLPTEEEWECAARGTDGREYPWGDEFDADKVNSRETGIGDVSPIGVFPNGASPCGALDMAGNVWEWMASEHEAGGRVLRGGSCYNDARNVRGASRFGGLPWGGSSNRGFRCARSV